MSALCECMARRVNYAGYIGDCPCPPSCSCCPVVALDKPNPTPTEDTAVIDAETPADPIPAEGAPHAWVALKRYHSPNADRPEWLFGAAVVPAHDAEDLAYYRKQGYELLPIGPDGDTGTRAIAEPRKITDFAEFTHLPVGTVVAGTDTGTVSERVADGWMRIGHTIACYHHEVFVNDRAVIVLRMGSPVVSDGE
ncbi:hypothetical protein [Nocardia sp. NPDC058480]|uniref:hypothetical protein n=1 Tax=Nocardia sp. NPDC058480 TaxID=3346522 RepID=UPI0036551E44